MLTPENTAAALEKCRPHATGYTFGIEAKSITLPDKQAGQINYTVWACKDGHNLCVGDGPTLAAAVADFCAKNPLPGEWRPVSALPPNGRMVEAAVMDDMGEVADSDFLHRMHDVWYKGTVPVLPVPTHWREIQYPEAH